MKAIKRFIGATMVVAMVCCLFMACPNQPAPEPEAQSITVTASPTAVDLTSGDKEVTLTATATGIEGFDAAKLTYTASGTPAGVTIAGDKATFAASTVAVESVTINASYEGLEISIPAVTIDVTLSALQSAKFDYTAKVAELNTAKTTSLSGVTTVVFGEVAEADKFEVPFGGKYITKGDLKTYTDLLAKTADEVATGDDDTAKTTAVNTATTALDTAKTTFEAAIKTLDEKWNADHFWATSGGYDRDQITSTGKNSKTKVAGSASDISDDTKNSTYSKATLKALGYSDADIASFTDSTTVECKANAKLTGYYDSTNKMIKFWKTRSAIGYVTEFDSKGEVTRIKIVQTYTDAIANVGNGLKPTEVDWYKAKVGNYGTSANDKSWAESDDFPGGDTDIKAGMPQFNVDFRFAGKLRSAEGVDSSETTNCSGLTMDDVVGNAIKLVRLADNSGKKVTGNVACGGGTADTNKTYTQGATSYGDIAETDTKIPIVAGKTSVYKVTLQKDAGSADTTTGIEQGEGLIMDFVVNINAAAIQPFADYQFREN